MSPGSSQVFPQSIWVFLWAASVSKRKGEMGTGVQSVVSSPSWGPLGGMGASQRKQNLLVLTKASEAEQQLCSLASGPSSSLTENSCSVPYMGPEKMPPKSSSSSPMGRKNVTLWITRTSFPVLRLLASSAMQSG